jgi:hypothetical protein
MGSIEKLHRGVEVNLAQLEEDIGTTVHSAKPLASTTLPSTTLPDYVEPQNGVPRVGALSAEAVVRDYEAAAKEIEAMGAELIDAAKKCEAMTAEVHNAIAYMRDTAKAYREEAKKIFKRIEDCALFTENVRKTCEEVKRKMVEGTTY